MSNDHDDEIEIKVIDTPKESNQNTHAHTHTFQINYHKFHQYSNTFYLCVFDCSKSSASILRRFALDHLMNVFYCLSANQSQMKSLEYIDGSRVQLKDYLIIDIRV